MQKSKLMVLAIIALFIAAVQSAFSANVSFKITEKTTAVLPLQIVSGVQLYSPEEGKGYPGVETVLVERKTWRLAVGAAPVLGTSVNVPFASLSTRLSPKFFDISDNQLYFGAWAGKPSDGKKMIYGVCASIPLW